jgi:hypothetical protein
MIAINYDKGMGRAYIPETELEEWWLTTAIDDLQATVPKAEEYGGTGGGSADLRVMGDALGEFANLTSAPLAVRMELACWFYCLGKIARLISDYKAGRVGKPDTWHDMTVYTMMARRLQEVGQWPG